jgi:transposase
MKISSEIKLHLEQRVKQTRDVHERLRLCVILSSSEGVSAELIAQTHRISVDSVYRYLREYENETKTKHDQRGGSESKLDAKQTQELLDYLQKVTYLRAQDICKYVKNKYGVEYSIPGMLFWLNEHGFEYKKPVKIPGKVDPQKQEAFIEKYEELKLKIGPDEEIYFMDAVHPAFQSQSVCGWIKKGEVKTLPTTNKQHRLHFIGAITLEKMEITAQECKTVDAENVINFIKNLETSSQASKIHVICDNGRSNKNKALQKYLETSKIQIHYLPPYSPNLNPIERLWKLMRERKTYNKCYMNFAQFTEAIRGFFFEDIPKMKDVLKQRINDRFQRILLNTIEVAVP